MFNWLFGNTQPKDHVDVFTAEFSFDAPDPTIMIEVTQSEFGNISNEKRSAILLDTDVITDLNLKHVLVSPDGQSIEVHVSRLSFSALGSISMEDILRLTGSADLSFASVGDWTAQVAVMIVHPKPGSQEQLKVEDLNPFRSFSVARLEEIGLHFDRCTPSTEVEF